MMINPTFIFAFLLYVFVVEASEASLRTAVQDSLRAASGNPCCDNGDCEATYNSGQKILEKGCYFKDGNSSSSSGTCCGECPRTKCYQDISQCHGCSFKTCDNVYGITYLNLTMVVPSSETCPMSGPEAIEHHQLKEVFETRKIKKSGLVLEDQRNLGVTWTPDYMPDMFSYSFEPLLIPHCPQMCSTRMLSYAGTECTEYCESREGLLNMHGESYNTGMSNLDSLMTANNHLENVLLETRENKDRSSEIIRELKFPFSHYCNFIAFPDPNQDNLSEGETCLEHYQGNPDTGLGFGIMSEECLDKPENEGICLAKGCMQCRLRNSDSSNPAPICPVCICDHLELDQSLCVKKGSPECSERGECINDLMDPPTLFPDPPGTGCHRDERTCSTSGHCQGGRWSPEVTVQGCEYPGSASDDDSKLILHKDRLQIYDDKLNLQQANFNLFNAIMTKVSQRMESDKSYMDELGLDKYMDLVQQQGDTVCGRLKREQMIEACSQRGNRALKMFISLLEHNWCRIAAFLIRQVLALAEEAALSAIASAALASGNIVVAAIIEKALQNGLVSPVCLRNKSPLSIAKLVKGRFRDGIRMPGSIWGVRKVINEVVNHICEFAIDHTSGNLNNLFQAACTGKALEQLITQLTLDAYCGKFLKSLSNIIILALCKCPSCTKQLATCHEHYLHDGVHSNEHQFLYRDVQVSSTLQSVADSAENSYYNSFYFTKPFTRINMTTSGGQWLSILPSLNDIHGTEFTTQPFLEQV